MAYGVSNGHVNYGVTLPRKVKLVTRRAISRKHWRIRILHFSQSKRTLLIAFFEVSWQKT